MTLHTVTPARPFATVNASVQPGDAIRVGDGIIPDSFIPATSGTADAPILVYADGENVQVNGKIDLREREHIHVRGLHLHSRSAQWVTTNDASSHYSIENCRFTSEWRGQTFTFAGCLIRGQRPRFVNNRIETWYGGDAVQWWATRGLFRDNDMSACNVGHGVLMLYGNYNVVTGNNPIVNRWSRAGEFVGRGLNMGWRNVVEGLHITNSGWDAESDVMGWGATGDGPGDLQLLKLGGVGTIFRHNRIHHNHPLMRDPYSYAAMIQFANYAASSKADDLVTDFDHLRAYDNAIYDNPLPAFSASRNPNIPLHAEDMRVWTAGIDGEVIRHNTMPDLQLLEGTYQPVVQAVNGDVVTLEDAWGLTDGNGVEGYAGDVITMWGQQVRVVEWMDGQTVRVSPAPVREEPPIVVVPPVEEPEIPGEVPDRALVSITIEVVGAGGINVTVNGRRIETND